MRIRHRKSANFFDFIFFAIKKRCGNPFTKRLRECRIRGVRSTSLFGLGLLGASFGSVAVSEEWTGFVAETCLECHDADVQKGGLNFEPLLDEGIASHAGTAEKALRQIDARQMPPLGKDRPVEEEYIAAVASLTQLLDNYAASNPNPGRTDTIRRLTRYEYGNAIRDLLGIEVDVTELLPKDEASHGFDNVTVGELSPALLDRYLDAARKISRLAVGAKLSQPDSRTIRIRPDITQEHHVAGLPLGTRGGALLSHTFPRSGVYRIDLRLTRDRNESVEGLTRPHDIEILLDGVPTATVRVNPPRDRKDHTKVDVELGAEISVAAGQRQLGVTFREDSASLIEENRQPYESRFNFHRHPRQTPAIYQVTFTGPMEDAGAGNTASRKRIFSFRPGEKLSPTDAARKNLSQLASLAWRRSLKEGEINPLLGYFEESFEQSGEFDSAMDSALAALLVSREFLFRIEAAPEEVAPGTRYALSSNELASRLSFFLWSSLPDSDLIDAAGSDQLIQSDQVAKHVDRMLADSRSEALVENFADQWLYLRNLDSLTPDGRLFPDFDHNLREAFREETKSLVRSVIEEDRSVLDLLSSRETWLNERLAKHYGIPHIYGSRMRRVSLDPEYRRGGLLRHGSILTVTSYATRTSPVIRGNWILENLMGTPPPPPPADVPALEDNAVDASLPMRERLAVHREKAACASCHNLMDPIGFPLENFDAIGRWRSFENGHLVDASGRLPGRADFDGVAGLEKGMLQRPDMFVRTLTEKLLTYALGRGIEPSDASAIRKVVKETAPEYRFSDLVKGITRSEPFRWRMSALD